MPLHVIEGTWEEIERRKTELQGQYLRVTLLPQAPPAHQPARKATQPSSRRPSAFGKYAFVAEGSEEFARRKQEEIAQEEIDREDQAGA